MISQKLIAKRERERDTTMASIAATGVLKVPPAAASCEAVPTRPLSFSSSVSLSDEWRHRRESVVSRGRMRNPMIVSPKAVSDSQNSQTCLDPDASRVSFSSSLSDRFFNK